MTISHECSKVLMPAMLNPEYWTSIGYMGSRGALPMKPT
eukprot:CAMPEP_0196184364 /NCGR_PEP_ID=MMETSP0911-20130528/33769_1 /TAXON_ID=49265 /ORGANISM="Thalassiosira rotula, Strain GSO102" /LENGTH=38 /DNA_ID= /DNA_START= /DNA_END= /DNA_ORIENTATION=